MTQYLTRDTVQEMLGLSDKKVRALFLTEGFPAFRLGGQGWYIRADKLDNWLEEHEGTTVELDYTRV
ncbi:MAG: helix-turn-helix domain-containing protein [Eubacteriales bacterium]|nr:helix-turn-helix domain-containing protein [Eubacteriales bacterium]